MLADPERLTDQLVNDHPIGKIRTLDQQRQARVDKATAKLICLGIAAFPALVAHRNDARYSHTFVGSFNEGPLEPPLALDYSVGETCVEIIARQLNAGSKYLGCRDYIPYGVPVSKLPEWWKARSSRSLAELRKEALEWTIAREKTQLLSPSAISRDCAAYRLKGLEAELRTLDKQRKMQPSSGMRPLGSRTMVDEHGTIWLNGRPVGFWGVDTEPMSPR